MFSKIDVGYWGRGRDVLALSLTGFAPIAAIGGRTVVLCTHIGMATREHHLAEINNEACHRKVKCDPTKALTTRRALLLAFPVLYTSGLLP